MGRFFTQVLRWFLGSFTRLFQLTVNNFTATKVIMGTLFIIILPIVLNNLIFDIMDEMLIMINSYASSNSPSLQTAISFTGLGGYLIRACGVIDGITIVLSAMVFRFAISWIPFVGPR